jgi:hypothetical protein
MSKRKYQFKIEELRRLMIRSKFWAIKEDVQEVLDFHRSNIEKEFDAGVTPNQLMAKWPNW